MVCFIYFDLVIIFPFPEPHIYSRQNILSLGARWGGGVYCSLPEGIRSGHLCYMMGFCELLIWVSTKALGNIRYLTINTWSNRVAIISSLMLMCHLHCVLFYYSCSTFIRFLFILCSTFVFHLILLLFIVHCSRKYSILILDCIPGISIPFL
jgi:hypothetical protein